MRRFFLAQGVGFQEGARPLPYVIQPVQRPAECVVREAPVRADLEHLLEQRDSPAGVGIVEILWRGSEQGGEQVFIVFVQQRRAPTAAGILEGGHLQGASVGIDPVGDALASHAEHIGDVGGGASLGEFQDSEGAAVQSDVPHLAELVLKLLPLPGC
jgi:hypothetical protein